MSDTRSLASLNGESSGSGSGSSTTTTERKKGNVAGKMAAASGKAFGDFTLNGFKAATVDIPLACSEGLKNVPALYGDKVRDNGRVTDWKSGAIVGGKSFMYGMGEGLTDIFVQPYRGAQKEGAVGALKGVGKGTVSLITKTGSGTLLSRSEFWPSRMNDFNSRNPRSSSLPQSRNRQVNPHSSKVFHPEENYAGKKDRECVPHEV